MTPRSVIIESSSQAGQVAVALGDKLLARRRLDESRRHARDLAPALRELLLEQGWKARQLDAIMVSRGPGSYTGLRVGMMTAKTLAFATGAAFLAIDTFAAVARQTPQPAGRVDVLADAQQDKVYVQRFKRLSPDGPDWQAENMLAIRAISEWLSELPDDVWVSGPGLHRYEPQLSGRLLISTALREPLADSLLALGLKRFRQGERDDFWTAVPLYLRPSAAEEKLQTVVSPASKEHIAECQ